MTDINARVLAKGCANTGITDELANSLHANLGKKVVAVVELVSEARTEKRDGKETVSLSILTLEPAPDTQTAEHLRELARAFHFERQLDTRDPGQLRLDDGSVEPNVADVLAAGGRHRPHPFLPDDAAKEQPICDVCGGIEASAVHSVQEALETDDPDLDTGDDDQGEADDSTGIDDEERHMYDEAPGFPGCSSCDHPVDHEIHRAPDGAGLVFDEPVDNVTHLRNPFDAQGA